MANYRKCPFELTIADSDDELQSNLVAMLKRCSNQALQDSKTFRIGLSGGSLVQILTSALVSSKLDTAGWKFFFCDERYVPHDNKDSTYWAYKTQMLTQLPTILDSQFVKADTSLTLDDCARDYEAQVKNEFGTSCPEFDLLLLGMGPDGHTCSLFPEQPDVLKETEYLVIPIRNSPKPPPERITFTLPLLTNAKEIVFVITGESKAAVVKRVFIDEVKEFPAAWVKPKYGRLSLLTDTGAGSLIQRKDVSAII